MHSVKMVGLGMLLVGCMATPVSAHLAVKPAEAKPAAFQTFTVGVPVEKEVPMVGLRLVIPEGVAHVTPNVKPGWTIATTKTGEGEEVMVTEISWTGGTIPVGQRDEFLFSAKLPATEGAVQWIAYQTYADGEVVAWDQDPGLADVETPYSKTMVAESAVAADTATTNDSLLMSWALAFSVVALLTAGYALYRRN